MQTKQDAIISFSATVKNVLDTTKATIALEDTDIVCNCNTSVFNARKCIRDSLSILDYHRRHKEVKELVDESYKIINNINILYLMPYGEHFSRWSNHQFKKEMTSDPNLLNDLLILQKIEKKYPFYEDMVATLAEVQKMFIGFSEKLQKNLNTLEPSEFELSKKRIDRPKIENKSNLRRMISSSCDDLSSTSTDSIQLIPTTLSQSKTKYLGIKMGILSAGVSKTTSSESLASCSF